ncbi:MAG TPA: hypothetical protein VN131_01605 [Mobilitalea sp.]|nr:hypothetical protein [Mobilitalea sp.]
MINPVDYNYNHMIYPYYKVNNQYPPSQAIGSITGVRSVTYNQYSPVGKTQQTECQTCKNRKYVDKSNDANVSYQTPTHISPEAAYAAVSSHEGEHVRNAVNEGREPGKQLVTASVQIKMSICPECGKPYISGGVTTTQVKYNTSNPYDKARKQLEGSLLRGSNVDYVA